MMAMLRIGGIIRSSRLVPASAQRVTDKRGCKCGPAAPTAIPKGITSASAHVQDTIPAQAVPSALAVAALRENYRGDGHTKSDCAAPRESFRGYNERTRWESKLVQTAETCVVVRIDLGPGLDPCRA